MKYRSLPQTSIQVSEVGFGTWTVGTNWWGSSDEVDRIRLLEKALDLGINFFDTADTYGNGYGEEILSKALGHQRHNLVIASKFGYDFYGQTVRVGHTERTQRFEPEFIRFACEQSLRRLGTDYIDIYQLHNPRIEAINDDRVFDLLDQLVKEGKIRYYGCAIGPDIGWVEEGQASMYRRDVCSLQIIYSILEQKPAMDFFPIAEEREIGLISRVPHASEVLTARFSEPPVFDPSDHRSHRKHEWMIDAINKMEKVKFLASGTGRTLAQAAIKFCLAQPSISSVLPNITNLEELKEYSDSSEVIDLDTEELDRLNDLWQNNFNIKENNIPAT